MSGNFVQRGEPAIFGFNDRAEMALEIGADAVVLMPCEYSTASSEIFSRAGVMIANAFANVTHLAFGVEDDKGVEKIVNVVINNQNNLQQLIKENINSGISYSLAKQNAIKTIIKKNGFKFDDKFFLPNNMLAMEYMVSLFEQKSDIIPLPIKRLARENIFSASQLREMINNGENIEKFVPYEIVQSYKMANKVDYDKFYHYVCAYISSCSKDYLNECRDMGEGLGNLFYNKIMVSSDYNNFLENITSKRYSVKRLKRAILACCLNLPKIKNKDIKIDNLKLVAVKKEVMPYLDCDINLVARVNDLNLKIENTIDERATRLYTKFLSQHQVPKYWLEKIIKK